MRETDKQDTPAAVLGYEDEELDASAAAVDAHAPEANSPEKKRDETLVDAVYEGPNPEGTIRHNEGELFYVRGEELKIPAWLLAQLEKKGFKPAAVKGK